MEDGEDANVQVHHKIGLATCYALVDVRVRDRLKPPDTQMTMRGAIEECRDAASCFRNSKPTNIHMNAVRKFTHCSLLTASLNLIDEVKFLLYIHDQHSVLGPGSSNEIVDKPQVKARCFLVNGYRICMKKTQGMSNRPGITAGKRRPIPHNLDLNLNHITIQHLGFGDSRRPQAVNTNLKTSSSSSSPVTKMVNIPKYGFP